MSKITTENCKDFLISYFKDKDIESSSKDWKRTSKYKENDLWIRDFSHPDIGSISVIEKNGILEINNHEMKDEKPEVSYFRKFTKDEVDSAKKLIKKLIKKLVFTYKFIYTFFKYFIKFFIIY